MTPGAAPGAAFRPQPEAPALSTTAQLLVEVIRDGVVESVHVGHLAVVAADGRVLASVGAPSAVVYPRSALKPLQALATLELLERGGAADELTEAGLAIMCASHTGTDTHQIEAAHLLALAGLDESALRCPPALPSDVASLQVHGPPTALAHNCSGKHAGFLWAQAAAGEDPDAYLDPGSLVQRRVASHLADVAHSVPSGPGVDGCGAPAWRLPLEALAAAFARLAAADRGSPLDRIRQAMVARPDLVGGGASEDTLLMAADRRVVAKRGAEAVIAAGIGGGVGAGPHEGVGIAVKVLDGGYRAGPPVLATVLERLGVSVPAGMVAPAVLGGGRPHGSLVVSAPVHDAAAAAGLA